MFYQFNDIHITLFQMQGMLVGEQAMTANMTINDKIAAMKLRHTMNPTVFSLSGTSMHHESCYNNVYSCSRLFHH